MTATEITTRYATVVEDITAAWKFVFEHQDDVGPDMSVVISPITVYGDEGAERRFEVSVSGRVEVEGA